jgi:hypothetical protein
METYFVNNAAGNSVHIWKGHLLYLLECPVYSCSGARPLTIQREALYWWKHTCQGPVLINASYQRLIVCTVKYRPATDLLIRVSHLRNYISVFSFTLIFSNI